MGVDLDALFQSRVQAERRQLDLAALFEQSSGEAPAPSPHPRPVAAEVFAGGGLYSLALAIEGVDVRQMCELDDDAVATLAANLHREARVCDARDWSPDPVEGGLDLLTGGPPCQPWSVGGEMRGSRDPRNMYPRALEWTAVARPRVVCWENSAKIASVRRFVRYFSWWWGEMGKIGYEGTTWVLNAADYGTPQARLRAFVVAWPRGAPWGRALRSPPAPTHGDPRSEGVRRRHLLPWVHAFDRLSSGCCGGYGLHDCRNIGNLGGPARPASE